MFLPKNAAILFGVCAALAACDGAPRRDLTAPDSEAGPLDAQSVSLLAPNTWAGKASLPGDRPRQGRTGLRASSLDNFIYVFGGRTPAGRSTRVDAYNITTNSWSPRAPLPSARANLNGASTINRLIYVTGGQANGSSFPLTRTLYVYNPATDNWVQKADMPQAGGCGAQGVIGGLLYVYVGCTNVQSHHLFRYNPATNIWVTRAAPPTRHSIPAAAGVISGRFYLAGGATGGVPNNRTLDVYNPVTNTWTTRAPMPGAQGVSATGVIGGRLFAAGGVDAMFLPIGTLRVYNPVTNIWTTRAPMPAPRFDAAGTPAAGLLFVIGGSGANGSFSGRNEAYTP
jgi:N-acetylneuraminic acid mutarotase